jgi:hypothetical protein
MLVVRLDGIQQPWTVFPRSTGTEREREREREREVRERAELGGSLEGVSEGWWRWRRVFLSTSSR